jgi:S1-C subfamily serine protease
VLDLPKGQGRASGLIKTNHLSFRAIALFGRRVTLKLKLQSYSEVPVHAREIAKLLGVALAIGALFYAGFACLSTTGFAGESPISAAICSVVYQLDQESAERGYRYIFYGNAFFIDKEGYLLTAAHVLTDFRDGGQPQILLRLPEAPPRLVKIETVASDSQHDIAIVRAVPNPFTGRYAVSFLALASAKPLQGSNIFAASLRPARLKDPHTFDAPTEVNSPAEILQYTALRLNKGQPESELFLFNHEVIRGQSGAPIVSRDTQEVVGIVEGQWLRGVPVTSSGRVASGIGAGLPITYALSLLDQEHVGWETASEPSK